MTLVTWLLLTVNTLIHSIALISIAILLLSEATQQCSLSGKSYICMDSTKPYEINCINATDKSYYFAVFFANPFEDTKAVAWQVTDVPSKGEVPSQSPISWELNFGVAIVNGNGYDQNFTIRQSVDAKPGSIYEVVKSSDAILSIEPEPKRSTASGMFWLKNNTSEPFNLGFTVSDKLVVVEKIQGGEVFIYKMPSKYFVACFRNRPRAMKEGLLLDTSVAIGPVEVQFSNGYTSCQVEAAVDGGEHILKEPEFTASLD